MKKYASLLLVLILCLSLTSCAGIMADITDAIDNAGYDQYTHAELEAQYQADLDELSDAWQELMDLIKPYVEEKLTEFFNASLNFVRDAFFDIRDRTSAQINNTLDNLKDQANDTINNTLDNIKDQAEDIIDDGKIPSEIPSIDWASAVGDTIATITDSDGWGDSYSSENNPYAKNYSGQCTWYAWGRFYEKNGIKLPTAPGAGEEWLNDNRDNPDVTVIDDPTDIRPNSVAVTSGHVIFIEDVTYDENGNPETIYFTECNWDVRYINAEQNPKWGTYNEGDDCVVKTMSYEEYMNNPKRRPQGYIVPNK